jgi:hypothetical protein
MLLEAGHEHHHDSSLGGPYLINDAGDVFAASGAQGHHNNSSRVNPNTSSGSATLVTEVGSNLEIKLVWDTSISKAPNGFKTAIIDAAQYFVDTYLNPLSGGGKDIVNIKVGYGEIAGQKMSPWALGESESYGYLTNYATVTGALAKDGYSFSANNEPASSQFFVTSADAKTMGLVSGTSTATDGFIGFSTLAHTGYSWNLNGSVGPTNSGTGANQFDLESVAMHEISEVMGRIGMEGQVVNHAPTYTPLDLFNFASPGHLELGAGGGYFSVDNGQTDIGTFNAAALYGGDIADWASAQSITDSATLGLLPGHQDSFDAFAFPGVNGDFTTADQQTLASLGYEAYSPVVA